MSNTLLKLHLREKDFGCKKNDKDNMGIAGATNEVATLKEAVAAAERNAAVERTERAARKGRNPRTGEEIQIPAGYGVKLTAGSALKKAVTE